jgi:hypothetical protein
MGNRRYPRDLTHEDEDRFIPAMTRGKCWRI